MFLCFFFFKQKTAYEMRISDWSSDVCSSDLVVYHGQVQAGHAVGGEVDGVAAVFQVVPEVGGDVLVVFDDEDAHRWMVLWGRFQTGMARRSSTRNAAFRILAQRCVDVARCRRRHPA